MAAGSFIKTPKWLRHWKKTIWGQIIGTIHRKSVLLYIKTKSKICFQVLWFALEFSLYSGVLLTAEICKSLEMLLIPQPSVKKLIILALISKRQALFAYDTIWVFFTAFTSVTLPHIYKAMFNDGLIAVIAQLCTHIFVTLNHLSAV